MAKYSIFLDKESEMLMQHLIMLKESRSAFIQRMIREAGEARGLFVETRVIQK